MRAVGCSASTPLASSSATPRHTSAAGAGHCSVPSTEASGIRMKNTGTTMSAAGEHAEELGEELLARVGAEQVAALEVGEQVARVRRWRRR